MFLALAGTVFLGSCSDDDNQTVAKSIALTSNFETVQLGGSFTFTVKNDLTKDVTSISEIFVNDVKITGTTFTPTAAGTYTVHAVSGGLTSPDITLTVTGAAAATSIAVTSNVSTVVLGGSFTFTVTNNLGANVTSASVISVNNVAITGATYTPTAVGTYTVKAVNGALTSADFTVTVTAAGGGTTANDSFVYDGTNYTTPAAGFGFRGIFETAQNSGQYVIVWDFTALLAAGTDDAPTTPNVVAITSVYPITPSGTDPDTGEPTFTASAPTAGTITWDDVLPSPALDDILVVANNQAVFSDDQQTRYGQIDAVNFNLTSVTFPASQGGASNAQTTYSVNLTNGKVINGEYSGSIVVYDATDAGRSARSAKRGKFVKLTKFKNVKLSKGAKPFKLK